MECSDRELVNRSAFIGTDLVKLVITLTTGPSMTLRENGFSLGIRKEILAPPESRADQHPTGFDRRLAIRYR